MNLKVKHNELNNVKKNLNANSEKLNTEIELWLNCIEKLRTIWQGDDANLFCDKAEGYVSRMKVISSSFDTIGNFIKEADDVYLEKDMKLKNNLEKEANNYE